MHPSPSFLTLLSLSIFLSLSLLICFGWVSEAMWQRGLQRLERRLSGGSGVSTARLLYVWRKTKKELNRCSTKSIRNPLSHSGPARWYIETLHQARWIMDEASERKKEMRLKYTLRHISKCRGFHPVPLSAPSCLNPISGLGWHEGIIWPLPLGPDCSTLIKYRSSPSPAAHSPPLTYVSHVMCAKGGVEVSRKTRLNDAFRHQPLQLESPASQKCPLSLKVWVSKPWLWWGVNSGW